MKQLKRIVVIGGGTGTFVVLSGLKQHNLHLTAIVTVADSGGSTGRLRDQFGFLPVGDLRQSLAALAHENDQSWIRNLLLYRFSKGKELKGHNLGNLILTALQDMVGSTPKALEIAGNIFRLKGHIYPVTTQNVQLVTKFADGTSLIGEHHLNPSQSGGKKIKSIHLTPKAKIYSKAKDSILAADMIVVGPGDLYASILPNLIVAGAKKALNQTQAKLVYIVNLMTRYTQTHGFTANDHVETLKHYLGRYPDYVIINTSPISPKILASYRKDHEFPVKNDLTNQHFQVIKGSLATETKAQQQTGDEIVRSLLRHHETKLTNILLKVLKQK